MQRQSKLHRIIPTLVLLTVFTLAANSPAMAQDNDHHGNIVGTWIATITVDTPPGAPPFVFTELAAFNPGGTFTDTIGIAHASENPFVPPPLAVDLSDAYGSWRRVDESNRFALTFKRLLYAGANTPTALYGPFFQGQHVGEATVQAVLALQDGEDGDTLRGRFTFQLRNLRGEVVLAASGTVSATRLKIEPLATP